MKENNTVDAAVRAAVAFTESRTGSGRFSEPDSTLTGIKAGYSHGAEDGQRPVTAAEVAEIVRAVLSEIRIYVLESDITDAQNAVRAIVEQSRF